MHLNHSNVIDKSTNQRKCQKVIEFILIPNNVAFLQRKVKKQILPDFNVKYKKNIILLVLLYKFDIKVARNKLHYISFL